ncbi:MAG TPA: type II toxin-antitoxin system VapC family toxin [Polyangia bacterium]|jgi:tRNA(fMet)-specific endonuclease VapC
MRIVIDTNRYVDFGHGVADVEQRLRTVDEILVPFVTLAALRAGFACGAHPERNERHLTAFLNSPRVEVVCADEATTHHYARLFAQLRRQGTPLPTNDLWIAALAVQHDAFLFARDRHFDHLPQLARI